MPELPEVETTARKLARVLSGRKICGVTVNWQRTVDRPSVSVFKRRLLGATISQVTRRGKYLIFFLSNDWKLLTHLRMSGELEVVKRSVPKGKHERVTLLLDNACELRFEDTRKFGRMYLVRDIIEVTGKLGPEPLTEDFSDTYLLRALKVRTACVKTLLLDQTLVAGVGNIYAIEALWRARVKPQKKANKLSTKQVCALRSAIREVLKEAIISHGTDLGDGVWKVGDYTPKIYGNAGQSCPRCRTTIRHVVISQRGTDYCPSCQRK